MQYATLDAEGGLVFEEQNGRFLHRRYYAHEQRAVRAIIARRVEADVEAFAKANAHLYLARESSPEVQAELELREILDPYEGFCDPDDFPQVWR